MKYWITGIFCILISIFIFLAEKNISKEYYKKIIAILMILDNFLKTTN